VGGGEPARIAVGTCERHRRGTAVFDVDRRDRGLHQHGAASAFDQVAAALPHHARPVLRVLELLDEAGDLLLVALGHQGVEHSLAEVEVLHPLRRPVGGHVGDRHPQTFSV